MKVTVTGEHVTGEHVTGEHVTGEHVTGEHVTGEHVTGEHVTGEHVTGEHVTGENRNIISSRRLGRTESSVMQAAGQNLETAGKCGRSAIVG